MLGKEWTKRWLNPMVGLTVLLAAAVIGALVFWSQGPISSKKADVGADSVDRARQAAEAQVADAAKARQAAEAKAAEATAAVVKSEQARQAAEAQAADAEKARQVAAATAADAEKARQVASKTADDAEKARQAATAKAAEADKARQAAEAKAAEATDAAAKSEQARQAAEVHAREADKARQVAEAKAAAPVPSPPTAGTVTSGLASPSSQFLRRSNAESKDLQRSSPFWVTAASVVDCERTCSQSNTCKVYNYNKKLGLCYMYSVDSYSVADLVPSENYDSGVLATVTSGLASPSGQFSRRSNMDATGTRASPYIAAAASIVDCEQSCAKSNTCKVYTYNKTFRRCYMYEVANLYRMKITMPANSRLNFQ
jgi:hypothetical protein